MTLGATHEWDFSSEQGKANYQAARRQYPAQAIVDLAALRDNMRHLVNVVGGPHSGTAVMGVVKADAYGHGLIPAALAALAGGATWLGTAQSHEALLLRKAGIGADRCHILTWVYSGAEVPFDELIANDIDISVGSLAGIDGVAAAARRLGKTARVHVKVDSGFGRNGFTPATFDTALAKLVPLAKEGVLHIVGQWSHLAVADAPDVPEFVAATDQQVECFKDFTRRMEAAGIAPEIRHLANTAATLSRPEIHFELTRPGIGLYINQMRTNMNNAEMYAHQMLGNLKNGITAIFDWNLMVDFKGGPNHVGNYCDAPIKANEAGDDYEKKLSFYYIGHFSRYIKEGARLIWTSCYTDRIKSVGFVNPDGERVVILLSESDVDTAVNVAEGESSAKLIVKAHSIQTLTYYA